MKSVVISGNEAVAFGAIGAGCRFFAGYPITPSSDLAEENVCTFANDWWCFYPNGR